MGRDTAIYVDNFLQRSKPGDFPVEQRAKFGFVTDCYS
jgi:hypothetical protein